MPIRGAYRMIAERPNLIVADVVGTQRLKPTLRYVDLAAGSIRSTTLRAEWNHVDRASVEAGRPS
jgi:hypothetical protein